ncbi:cell wall hydrolase [Cohaesibacter intestini]|uniref:cell wall hydrolase n=1 Tax=Cohaesibacter intestini TaxID=2211145 RepID=UPI003CCAFA06
MSKTTLGQKSLGLTTRMLLASGLVLSITQSLDERGMAGKSLAELRQEAWTKEILAGHTPRLRGGDKDVLAFQAREDELITGSMVSRFRTNGPVEQASLDGAIVKLATTSKGEINSDTQFVDPTAAMLPETLAVDRSAKGARRLRWHWEPYRVSHGRRAIALNWSGSVWTMSGPFSQASHVELPKAAFAPSDDLKLVMADASRFLLPEVIEQAPEILFASNKSNDAKQPVQQIAATTGNENTALAYAPNSADGLDAPFDAILTEQRTGRIHEDNQVTILGAVEDLNRQLDGDETPAKSAPADATSEAVTIATLPRMRAPREEENKVSQPLDVTPVVAALEAKHEAAIQQEQTAQTKNEGLTLAKSKAVRAELQLASLSGDKDVVEEKKSPFASWFNFSSKKKKVAKIDARGEHAWVTNPLPKSSFSKKQKTCLANAIYFESRSEPVAGQTAVAQVVMNRVKNPTYPNTICGVVYQNKHRRNACQFSFACDRIPDRIRSKEAWDTAWKVANQVVNGEVWMKSIGSSTHYHATYVRPRWARTMKRLKKIGLHVFYKTYGGGWS